MTLYPLGTDNRMLDSMCQDTLKEQHDGLRTVIEGLGCYNTGEYSTGNGAGECERGNP